MFTVKLSRAQHPGNPTAGATLIVEAKEVEIRWNNGNTPNSVSHAIVVRPGPAGTEDFFYHIGATEEWHEGVIENGNGKTTQIVRGDTYHTGVQPRAA